jgi:predicted TIM-barrel fold metal-dependent hydrolase
VATIVDVHCHNFNGDDLPVRGFIHRVQFDDAALAADLADAADYLVQKAAPGYKREKKKLDRLLGEQVFETTFETTTPVKVVDIDEELDSEVDEALTELEAANPALLRRIGMSLATDGDIPEEEAGLEGITDWYSAARRGIRWVKLFAKYRLDITRALIKNFDDRVDLFVPMTVDLGMGLQDTAETSMREQVELQEKISRLSMRGLIPGGGRAQVHPFIGFDPRRDLRTRMSEDIESALDIVRMAVERYGFIGVKLYPPMGWRPLGNRRTIDMTAAEGSQVDEILREFYDWCQQQQVPITAHSNTSNEAHQSYRDMSSPDNWKLVLEEFPNLRLNLGHFGGARIAEPLDGWPWKIAQLANHYDHLYADVGNHRVDKQELLEAYLNRLEEMFAAPATAKMQERLMYGSDWYMLAILPDHHKFLTSYGNAYRSKFTEEATDAFLGGTALTFLGFDDETNLNTQRLRARYERFAPERTPGWLAGSPTSDPSNFDLPGGR